jgi:hypothetical protein
MENEPRKIDLELKYNRLGRVLKALLVLTPLIATGLTIASLNSMNPIDDRDIIMICLTVVGYILFSASLIWVIAKENANIRKRINQLELETKEDIA